MYCKVSEVVYIKHDETKEDGRVVTYNRPVCPDCIEHKQGEAGEVNDCKVVFLYDQEFPGAERKTAGQCCCWSLSHGKGRNAITEDDFDYRTTSPNMRNIGID